MTYEKIELSINGMECQSCEVLLERKFRNIQGVKKAEVDHTNGKATLICSRIPSLEELQNTINDPKYTISFNNKTENINSNSKDSSTIKIKRDHIEIGAVFLIIVGLYLVFKQFKILPDLGISDNMSYGFIFLIGLVAAFSTCMAVSGGLLAGISTRYIEEHPNLSRSQKFKPHIYFNVGRIISYALLGGLLGALGSIFKLSTTATGIITIIASIVMIGLGFQLLKIFPSFNKLKFKMPKFISHKIHDASTSNSKFAPFLFGAATFFLPCGFTQALQIYVLSTGSFLVGSLTMLFFSLGTLPGLISVGAITSFSTGKFKKFFVKFVGVLIIMLALYNVNSGLNLMGSSISLDSILPFVSAAPGDTNVKIVDGKQIVEMKVDGLDYYPSRFNLIEGIPVEWHIDGRNAQGCAQVITVPKLGITEYLPRNQIKVIQFLPEEGTIKFSCSMGMAGPGVFNVIQNTGNIVPAKVGAAPAPQAKNNAPVSTGETQKLELEISRERGFYPNQFTVKKGALVELDINAKVQLGGCMSVLVIPKYDVAQRLTLGKSKLTFTPTETGTIWATCSMGGKMVRFDVV